MSKTDHSKRLALLIEGINPEIAPLIELEWLFAPPRRWRIDVGFPDRLVGVEIEGGVWTRGRHTRPSGFVKDMEKYNEAARRGIRILRYTPDDLRRRPVDVVAEIGDALAGVKR